MASPKPTGAAAGPSSTAPTKSSSTSSAPPIHQLPAHEDVPATQKKKRHRAGRKRKNRRQSFATPSDQGDIPDTGAEIPSLLDVPEDATTEHQFYRINGRRNSNTSLESEALLDHRAQPTTRPRRQSLVQSTQGQRSGYSHQHPGRPSLQSRGHGSSTVVDTTADASADLDSSYQSPITDRTPLMPRTNHQSPGPQRVSGYGGTYGSPGALHPRPSARRQSASSSVSRRKRIPLRHASTNSLSEDYDINNPPSIPGSPRLRGGADFDDVTFPGLNRGPSPERGMLNGRSNDRDAVIDMDENRQPFRSPRAGTPRTPSMERLNPFRRRPSNHLMEEDVCVPFDRMTEIAEEDYLHQEGSDRAARRSRKRPWPDLTSLHEYSLAEKEERQLEGVRAKRVNEPELVGGRLRPSRVYWQREEEEAPFRFTYFNEELDSSLRSYTLSGLQELGLNFQEMFIPECPEIEEETSDDEEEDRVPDRTLTPVNGQSRIGTRQSSILDHKGFEKQESTGDRSGQETPTKLSSNIEKPKQYGPRPVFWLDVLQPTYEEMRVLSRAFGIHKLTAEDIMEEEAREKVELFRHYYFVNYRTFEQDQQSDQYLDPINMYFVVFKGGVISFHFSQMPHPPNVRRRIRQLTEHQYTDSDWISYAIIDNITDAYAPLIEQIEREVDDIDDEILRLHSRQDASSSNPFDKPPKSLSKGAALLRSLHKAGMMQSSDYEKLPQSDAEQSGTGMDASDRDRDMLQRVGECRKKVMGLYRLLGNKADVIKGLAKRCNEQWQVAPRSDVGLYLGDIQDHIVTMTGNLTHYESILSRAHSNYLAQINIKMTERAEQTNDVLGKLTVLGTIVLPMNIITGMWGMNVTVPGQDNGNMLWFWGITAGLIAFGVSCFFIARKLYRVV